MFRTTSKHIILLYVLLNALALAGLWSCRKDEDTFTKYPVSNADFAPLLAQIPGPATKTTFILNNLDKDTLLSTPNGLRIVLTDTDNLFVDASGAPTTCSTCQQFRVEVTEVRRKSDMIARGVPTNSVAGSLLEGPVMVYITAQCNGQSWQLAPGRSVKIQVPEPIQVNTLKVFNASITNASFDGWSDSGEPVYLADWFSPTLGETVYGYELLSGQLGWVFCAQAIDEPSTPFCVNLPGGFSSENTKVYMILKNNTAIAALVSDGDALFCFDQAPIGFQVRIVTVSQYAGQYWLGNKETEIGSNGKIGLEPSIKTEQEVLVFLKSL
jgi:hypothetical protein